MQDLPQADFLSIRAGQIARALALVVAIGLRGSFLSVVALVIACAPRSANAQSAGQVLQQLCQDEGRGKLIADELAVAGRLHADSKLLSGPAALREQAHDLQERARYVDAQDALFQALELDTRDGERAKQDIADDLGSLGRILQWTSRYPLAGAMLQCVLTIRESSDGRSAPSTARALIALGEYEAVFKHYDQAISMLTRANDVLAVANGEHRGDLARAKSAMANVLVASGGSADRTKALFLYRDALTLNQQDPMCGSTCINVAISNDNLGVALTRPGEDLNSAEAYLKTALKIKLERRGNGHDSTATTLQSLARLDALRARPEAILRYREATGILLAITVNSGASDSAVLSRLAETSAEFANYCEDRGTPEGRAEALVQYTISIDARQKMRAGTQGLDAIYRADLDRAIADPYYRLADLLVEGGHLVEAEKVLELLKTQEFEGLLRSSPKVPPVQVGTSRAALDEFSQLATKSVEAANELAAIERRDSSTWSADERKRHSELLLQAQDQNDRYQRFLVELSRTLARSGEGSPTSAVHGAVLELGKKVDLDPGGAVGLHYSVSSQRIAIIVATPRGSFAHFSEVPRVVLSRQILALRTAIKARTATQAMAQSLWHSLIEPVVAELRASKAKTIVLSLTDDLRYLPFAALQDPKGRYLIQDYALVSWAGAADVKPAASGRPWNVAGMGVSEAHAGYPALPFVRSELRSIVRTADNPDGMLPGTISMDPEFSRERFEESLQSQASVLHVASHFDFYPGSERSSVLLLGKSGETLSLRQLQSMNFSHIELFTLSACETGLGGGVNENGAAIEGLAAAVLAAQAQAVISTLWKVFDNSTAELMKQFYSQHVNGSGVTRARALQLAQLAVMQGNGRTSGAKSRTIIPVNGSSTVEARPWAHPYYWAPFVLSGNWL